MKCFDCPRECGAEREKQRGFCGGGALPGIARAALHFWEEPCISGVSGSGAVFFCGCNLQCVYCQNKVIALRQSKTEVTISSDQLADIFLRLQDEGAHNINLVTPSHEVAAITTALGKAKITGLRIPVVYNTSAYEKAECLKRLEGLVDIWMPDLKYFSPEISARYSNAPDYFNVAIRAIAEMVRQAGNPVMVTGRSSTEAGEPELLLMKRGVLVRHLVLPTHTVDSKNILKYLFQTYGNQIYISIMNQFTPLLNEEARSKYPELTRRVTRREYKRVVEYALELGIENAYIQEGKTAEESFIPEFDGSGICCNSLS